MCIGTGRRDWNLNDSGTKILKQVFDNLRFRNLSQFILVTNKNVTTINCDNTCAAISCQKKNN